MRTTLDLPDPLLRNLKIQAAQSGKSLKTLLNELIVRAMAMPAAPAQVTPPTLPVLSRLSSSKSKSVPVDSSANLVDAQLQDDLDKLRRSGFIQ
jgi:hypothetical protein